MIEKRGLFTAGAATSPWIDERGRRTDSREGSFDSFKGGLAGLVHGRLVELSLNPNDLSLTMRFSNSAQMELLTDPADPEVDEWFIQLPSWKAVGVSASGRWCLQEDS